MRAISLLLLMLVAVYANAEERTWTISTGTYSVAAELVEVRGDIAYLKIGDNIEHIPFARLSGGDQQYIVSQSRPMIFPGPAEDNIAEESLPGPRNEFNAFPTHGAIAELQGPALSPGLSITANKPASEPLPLQQPQTGTAIRSYYNFAEELPRIPTTAQPPMNQTPKIDPRAVNGPNSNQNARRSAQAQQQNRNSASNQNRSREEERRGLFGGRSRRLGNGR